MATAASQASDSVKEVFLTGLKNAHALEHQALALMDRQIDHLAEYAEVEERLRSHRGETENQIARLEQILGGLGESHSAFKDVAMKLSGNFAALGHTFAPDEIIKNCFANFAFENFEIATYKALILMAKEAGQLDAVPLLEVTLGEEQAMAAFCDEILPMVVHKYLNLRAQGGQASH
jgi:ferritin-like metal-binding protein YciE